MLASSPTSATARSPSYGKLLFILWSLVLLAGLVFGGACTDSSAAHCPSLETVRRVSPRHIAKLIATAGPFPMWLLLFIHAFISCSAVGKAADVFRVSAPLLLPPLALYAGCVTVFRYAQNALPFDPSGHVFVIGLQLAPLCALLDRRSPLMCQPSAAWKAVCVGTLVIITGIWAYFSFLTAAYFHSIAEVLLPVLLCAWCFADTAGMLHAAPNALLSPLLFRIVFGLSGWAVSIILVLVMRGIRWQPPLLLCTLYDAILFACGLKLFTAVK